MEEPAVETKVEETVAQDGGATEEAAVDAGAEGEVADPAPAPAKPVKEKHACLALAWDWPEEALGVNEFAGGIGLPPIIASIDCDGDASDVLAATGDAKDKVTKFILAPRRLARSAAHQAFNEAKLSVLRAEQEYGELKGPSPKEEVTMKEEKMKEIETKKADAETKKAALDEFKGTLDAAAMAPWKCALMAAVESGLTCLTTAPKVDSVGYPVGLLSTSASAAKSAFADSELLVGGFNAQCVAEKGAAPSIIVNLCPTMSSGGAGSITCAALLEKACERLQAESATACLLHWYDFSEEGEARAIEAMFELSRLRRQKKVKLIGVAGFPADVLQKVIDSGVSVDIASAPYNFIDQRAALKLIPMCKEYGISFIAAHATAYGYLSSDAKTLAAAMGNGSRSIRAPLDDDAFDALMGKLSGVANEHQVSVETVAIRWVLDQGLIPIVPVSFAKPPAVVEGEGEDEEAGAGADEEEKDGDTAEDEDGPAPVPAEESIEAEASACWAAFGARGHLKGEPGFDARLIAAESFLLKADLEALTEAGSKVGHTGDAGEIESGVGCGYRV